MATQTTPLEQRVGMVAVQNEDGSFTCITLGLVGSPKRMAGMLTKFAKIERARKLVKRNYISFDGKIKTSYPNDEAPFVVKEPLALLARLKEKGGRYAAVRKLGDKRFHFYSLSIENETREIFEWPNRTH